MDKLTVNNNKNNVFFSNGPEKLVCHMCSNSTSIENAIVRL